MNDEIWKSVVGYEGRYEVSNYGRIRTLVNSKGKLANPAIRELEEHNGYLRVMISKPLAGAKRIQQTKFVHCLVLEAFVGPRPKGKQCAHLNGDRKDNRLENLKWVSKTENERHKIIHGTDNSGFRHPQSVLTTEIADRIVALRDSTDLPNYKIAEIVGVNQATVNNLLGRRAYLDYWRNRESGHQSKSNSEVKDERIS